MPRRKTILAVGEFYHIFNRSLNLFPIFSGKKEINYFLEAMKYYLWEYPPIKFSLFRANKNSYKRLKENKLISLVAFVIMSNHFHFLVKQEKSDGIRTYLQKLTNSFSHYFNLKNKRKGSLFEAPFKAVRIETEEQLIHVSRYIHLNPTTSYITENPADYPYSSYAAYMRQQQGSLVDPTYVLSSFVNKKRYEQFVLNQKDYQRKLQEIKHLLMEDVEYLGS